MDIVRQSLAITLVFALLWAALWFLRKRGAVTIGFAKGRTQPGLLQSRAKLTLTAQHSVHIIRIAERDLVLALHPSGVTLLGKLPHGAPHGNAGLGET